MSDKNWAQLTHDREMRQPAARTQVEGVRVE